MLVWGVALRMKPQHVAWIVWTGTLLVAAFVLATVCLLLFQGLYWLRFDQWYDWTAPDSHLFFGTRMHGAHWRGIEEISGWMSSAPAELWTFAAALTVLVLFTLVRISGRR